MELPGKKIHPGRRDSQYKDMGAEQGLARSRKLAEAKSNWQRSGVVDVGPNNVGPLLFILKGTGHN